MKTGSIEQATIQERLAALGITKGASVTWPSPVQERFGVFDRIERAFASSKPVAIVYAHNGTLRLDPETLVAAPEVQDAFTADYNATYNAAQATG